MAGKVMLAAALTLGLAVGSAQAQDERATPYWASISAGKAMMRTGPGQNYPATWLYVRADLPIQVVETYPNWRKVRDPEGTTGWMLQRLLSDRRTGLVTGDSPQPLRKDPSEDSKVRYLAEPGVVGRISKCSGDWCMFQVGDRQGYIRQNQIWGVKPGETLD
ncbi:MAG TPA: SH3 domain-containing protein [Allosphingosinicella sp.]|jgi:SH3-like domain-containing protein|nr:SH3 domain-containing protein [Allosphingosinicella sp.]